MPATGARQRCAYYRNPMGLPDTSPTPKKDSMGMDYIPVYEGEDTDGGTVTVSPGKVQRTGVRTAVVERRVVSHAGARARHRRRSTSAGSRSSRPASDAYRRQGRERHHRRPRPQGPAAGLASILAGDQRGRRADLIANPASTAPGAACENLNVSAAVIDEMERTRKVPCAITWSAPRDGVVLERNAIDGMKAAAGDTLFRIGDHSTVWVLADVPERDSAASA